MFNYKVGDEILTSYPLVHVIESEQRGLLCDFCLTKSEKLLRCSRCKVTYFCNRECQGAAWSDHRLECSSLAKVYPSVPTSAARYFARILIKLKGVDSKQLTEKVFGRERTFDDLMSNVEYIQKDAERMHQFRALWSTMEAYLGREWLPAPDAGLEIFGKMVINSYSICDEDNYPIGSGLYIGPSLLDHSCAPNAQAVFDGRKLILRAVADIDCDSIGGIRVCYVDVLDLRTERARILREQYYFDCGCGRCIRDQVAEYLTEKSPALTARVKLLWEELKKLGIPSDDGYARSRKEAERLLEANLLPESDVARIRALELASWCCIKQGDYEAALGHLAARVEPYRKCYGDCHPAYGALLFAIAKIHHLAGRFREAEDYFEKATKVVIVTHGQRHPHFRNLAEALHHCRMEMAATES